MRPFFDFPDFLPLKLKQGASYQSLQSIDWETVTDKHVREFLPTLFEPLKVRRTNYERPIGIIYNPNSGKKRDLRPLIEKRLSEQNIAYELLATEKSFDTFRYAYESDLSKYSALLAVGGDGSVSEVLNGMMARPDG